MALKNLIIFRMWDKKSFRVTVIFHVDMHQANFKTHNFKTREVVKSFLHRSYKARCLAKPSNSFSCLTSSLQAPPQCHPVWNAKPFSSATGTPQLGTCISAYQTDETLNLHERRPVVTLMFVNWKWHHPNLTIIPFKILEETISSFTAFHIVFLPWPTGENMCDK